MAMATVLYKHTCFKLIEKVQELAFIAYKVHYSSKIAKKRS